MVSPPRFTDPGRGWREGGDDLKAWAAYITGQAGETTGRARVPRMPKTPLSGKAQTVLGPVDGDAMGITLPHEHLLIDFKVMFKEPDAAADKGRALAPVSMANLGWIRQNFSSNLDNLRLFDEDVARDEALLFKHAGGQ